MVLLWALLLKAACCMAKEAARPRPWSQRGKVRCRLLQLAAQARQPSAGDHDFECNVSVMLPLLPIVYECGAVSCPLLY